MIDCRIVKSIKYSGTKEFKNSKFSKDSGLRINLTGKFFEFKVGNLLNLISPESYKKLNGSTYIPDLETKNLIISCKVQEGSGTAYQKLVFELMDLEEIAENTYKEVILLVSDYSWENYFYKLQPYLEKINRKVKIVTLGVFVDKWENELKVR